MKIHYNKEADVLTVEDETYQGYDRSVELGDMSLDLASDNEPLGLVVTAISDKTELGSDQLAAIDDVEVDIDGDGEALRITVTLHHPSGTYEITGGRRQDTGTVHHSDI